MKTIRFILISCLMLLAAVNVQANDFLEIQDLINNESYSCKV